MPFTIKDREIKIGNPVYIIAEISCNHEQSYEKAIQLIHEAKNAGADAVKFQTYTPDTITLDCDNEHFRINTETIWDGMTLHQLYTKAYTPWEWFPSLKSIADELNIDFFSTPFDGTAVDLLEELGVDLYKISSFEVRDHPLLKRIAMTKKPVIMSSGVSNLDELEESIAVLRKAGCKDICLLKCTSSYPAPLEYANLRTIKDMAERFNVISGLSDHTRGIIAPITAVALGACVIEKHFKLEEKTSSPDDSFSLTPKEFKEMVNSIRNVEKALGKVEYNKEHLGRKNLRFMRSLFVVNDIKKGELFTDDKIRSIRPGNGLHPRYYEYVLTKKAKMDIKRGTPLLPLMIDELDRDLEDPLS